MTSESRASHENPSGTADPASAPSAGTPFLRPENDGSGHVELAAELRRLRGLVAGSIFTDVHDAVAAVRELSDQLEQAGTPVEPSMFSPWGTPEHLGANPAIGMRNPVSPPLQPVSFPDGTVRCDLELGIEYQGPPGCVHGGIVALLFDAVLGRANHHAGTTGMTMYLDIDYRGATPLLEPIVVTGRPVRVEGRKVWTQGAIHADGRLCATAEGLFVTPEGWVRDGGRRGHE